MPWYVTEPPVIYYQKLIVEVDKDVVPMTKINSREVIVTVIGANKFR